ncbi:MAG: metallophosphoesterase family protein [Candidatus Eisenbacteria bacterium]|uniref:Metallophosphoesterase family protein n=1 Tax=Eiseniibacteriota bacterium TaxID=2212470 RepID=A0A849SUW9_UNCEI|nr:metallophosphoesterase family protein [Candidatus Eisenbacteria bacterium]
MRHAIVTDIHGNLEALETVLADIERRRPDSIQCLGDFVGYGASPNECIDRLQPLIEHSVAGNHDLAACGRIKLGYFNHNAALAARWTESNLTPAHREYLRGLPFQVEWRGTRLVHSSPAAPEEWHYVLSPAEAAEEMTAYVESLCFIGHSHYPGVFDRHGDQVRYTRAETVRVEPGHRYLVNVGSVGQPRDGDPRAAYLIWDEGEGTLQHVRLEYDIAGAMRRIHDAGLPRFLAERLQWGE